MATLPVPHAIVNLMPESFLVYNASQMTPMEVVMWMEDSNKKPQQVIYLSRNDVNDQVFKVILGEHKWNQNLDQEHAVQFTTHADSLLLHKDRGHWWNSTEETPSKARIVKFLSENDNFVCGICDNTFRYSGRSCNQCCMDMCRDCTARSFVQNQTCPGCRQILDCTIEDQSAVAP